MDDSIKKTPLGGEIKYSREEWDKLIDLLVVNGFHPTITYLGRKHSLVG